jgi:hypothetical protein
MRGRDVLLSRAAAAIAALVLAAGCGSSAVTSTAPSPISRCAIALDVHDATLPATGGSGAVSVSATRDCAWSATVDGSWITLKSGSSGQGEGTVEFAASANPDPQSRTGAVVINGTRAQITQSAADCVITLAESAANFPPTGGTGQANVRASSQLCTWTATSDSGWIEITSSANGRGSSAVTFSVAPTGGPPRAGSLTIAGQRFSVTQSEGCAYSIDRTTHNAGASGGSGTVAVATAAACPWTAASNAAWLTVTPASGSGPGPVTFSIAPTQGPERTGTAVIAGQLFTVTQSPGCSYQVQPTSHSVGASGGSAAVNVNTADGCAWTAVSNASWITIQGAASGTGHGNVTLAIAATTGPARSGTVTVAGQQVSVFQTQGCTFAISPQSQAVPSSGGSGKVTVTAGDACAWTATSSDSWLTIVAGSSGTGNGEVQFSAAATAGPSRSATLTIAGQTFTVIQGEGCAYSLSPQSYAVPPAGGTGTVNVTAGSACAWTATSGAPWLTITSGSSGSGTGSVNFSAAANTGPARSGTLTIAGIAFTVTQSDSCSYAIKPKQQDVPGSGGLVDVTVTAAGGCPWTATSNAPWITVVAGASGTGSGSVRLSIDVNTGGQRKGTVTIAGEKFTIVQDGGCAFAVTPDTLSSPATGGPARVDVATSSGCAWTAVSSAAWITVTAGASGSGNGSVDLSVGANTGPVRSGTVAVAGRTVTVTQESGCTIAITPRDRTIDVSGGSGSVTVTAGAGCTWTATSTVTWIAVVSGGSGSGDGVVQYTVEANPTGSARTGTIAIGGQTFMINQAGL